MRRHPQPHLLANALVAVLSLWLLVAGSAAVAQPPAVEEVELTEAETPAVEVRVPETDRSELERLLAEAETVFRGPDRPASLPLYGRVVDILEAERAASGEPLDPLGRLLWTRSLLRRAQIYHQLGEAELAEANLARRFAVDPDAAIDPTALGVDDVVGDDFARMAQRVRSTSIGEITLVVLPTDAEVWVDGRVREAAPNAGSPEAGEVTVAVTPGLHVVEITRPGHTPVRRELEVEAGRALRVEEELERVSPVLRLATRPSGAEVRIDGRVVGTTQGVADDQFLPHGAGAIYRREEFSDELVIDGLELGLRRLEVRQVGHRPYRMELQIDQPIDVLSW